MLTIKYLALNEVAQEYCALGIKDEPLGANFVMYDDDVPVALWRMQVIKEEEWIADVDKVYFVDGVEDGDKLFFTHAMFFKLIEGTPILVRFKGKREELSRFGFEEVDGNMIINSSKINLHYMCKG